MQSHLEPYEFPRIFGPIHFLVSYSLFENSTENGEKMLSFHQSRDLPKNPSDEVMVNGAIIKVDRQPRTTPASKRREEEAEKWKIRPQPAKITDEHNLRIRPNFENVPEKPQKSVLTAVIQSLLTTEDYNRGLRPFEIEMSSGKDPKIQEDLDNILMEPVENSRES